MDDGSKRSVRGRFMFKIEHNDNGSFVASVIQTNDKPEQDDVGALYYVIAVIFIYGCSILMMIASYIRKNKTDRKLNRYLKEMANVRKREQQLQLLNAAAKAAAQSRKSLCVLDSAESSLGSQKWPRVHDEVFLDEPSSDRLCRSYSSSTTGRGDWSLKRADLGRRDSKHLSLRESSRDVVVTPVVIDNPLIRISIATRDPDSDSESLSADDRQKYPRHVCGNTTGHALLPNDSIISPSGCKKDKEQNKSTSEENWKFPNPEIKITEQN